MNENNNHENEISLIDIFEFLQESWKTIAGFTVLGFAGAAFYLSVVPKQYEASVQIKMAQIAYVNNNIHHPLGINIEEPALLISRLSIPTSYTPETLVACGLQDQANPALALSSIKLTVPKGLANLVELKTFGGSQQAAQDCALAVFDQIKTTQAQIMAPYIEEAKIKLADAEDRLAKAKQLLAKTDKSGSAIGAIFYLSTRDEIRYLLDEITAQKYFLSSNQNQTTSLLSPVYSSDMPIAPKKRNILTAGLFGGLFLGLLIALARQMTIKFKSQAGGTL
jgi:hypothetical protein